MLRFRLFVGISIVLAITAGCTAVPYGEVPPEKFVLGEDIIISSVDVSRMQISQARACLLYTSDAADDLLCVDLGGRRIIKKKIDTSLKSSDSNT